MLKMLTYKTEIGWALSIVAATATVAIFQIVFEISWLISVPVGILAYVTATVVWARYINSLEHHKPPRG